MPRPARRLLVISNGHGEDSIAAEIVRRLPADLSAEAYPTLGEGRAYQGVCPIVGPRAGLASEGWRNFRFSVLRDAASGGLRTLWPGLRFLREARHRYDRVMVVGDLVGVAGCALAGIGDILYLDVYRTGYGRLYSAPERWLIARTARQVFTRHEALAEPLRRMGVDARCAGNPMMDTIPSGDYDAAARRARPLAVTLLPGSRRWAPESFALQIAALRRPPNELVPDLFLALAGNVALADLAAAAGLAVEAPESGEAADRGRLVGGGLAIHVAAGALGNLLAVSDIVLSQAGTATIQALGSGRPAVTFLDPRDRKSRVRDESRLFGEARRLVAPERAALAEAAAALLADPAERARLGAIGRERIGPPGAMAAVLDALIAL